MFLGGWCVLGGTQVLTFLSILKFPMPEDERERETMANALAEGEKHVVSFKQAGWWWGGV